MSGGNFRAGAGASKDGIKLPPPDPQLVAFVRALAKADARRDRAREALASAENSPLDRHLLTAPGRGKKPRQDETEYVVKWTVPDPQKPTRS